MVLGLMVLGRLLGDCPTMVRYRTVETLNPVVILKPVAVKLEAWRASSSTPPKTFHLTSAAAKNLLFISREAELYPSFDSFPSALASFHLHLIYKIPECKMVPT